MAIPWKNNRQIGLNPNAVERGVLVPSAYYFGFNALGRTRPIQAQQDPGFYGPPFPLGQDYCLPEVIDWPFSVDSQGLAFDQANLYGIRGLCYNDKANSNQESDDFWIAVPRTLPAGYTRVGRALGDAYGFGGLTPNVNGNSYRLRSPGTPAAPGTPNHFYPGPGAFDVQTWAPCNVSQQTYDASVDNYYDFWGDDGAPGPFSNYCMRTIGPHCGFRDARLELSALFGPTGPGPGSVKISIYWDEPGTVLDNTTHPPQLPAHLLYSTTVAYSSFSGTWPGTGTYVISSVGSLLQPKKYPVLHYLLQQNAGTSTSGPSITARFGPRTDIPPPISCTTGNRYAPGGYPT